MAIETLEVAINNGFEYVHQQGFEWFKTFFLSGLANKENSLSDEIVVKGELYAASIYSLHEAPLKAKAHYSRLLELQDDHLEGNMGLIETHAQLGDFDLAIERMTYIKQQGVGLEDLKELEQDLIAMRTDYPKGYFEKGDLFWEMNEQIAEENFDAVIDTFASTSDKDELILLARSFGALDDVEGYLSVWEELANQKGQLEIDFADWFYMSNAIFDNHEIWGLLKSMLYKISDDSIFILAEGLASNYGHKGMKKLREITCDYHVARCNHDQKTIEALQNTFPLCQEFKNELLAE